MNKIDEFEGKYRFLSNFFPCVIEYEGITYPSTEHAYQAAKTLNQEHRQMIADMPTPGKAKKAGQIVEVREDWNEIKFWIMYDICKLKFIQPEFEEKLLSTGNVELIEGNYWHDNVWGVCTCSNCPGEGTNLLGKVLMRIRTEFIVARAITEEIDNEILSQLRGNLPSLDFESFK